MYDQNHLLAALRSGSLGRDDAVFAEGARTYGELFANAERVAAALAGMGVEPGDRVAAQVPKSLAAIELYLGAILAGAVFLPLNTAYTGAEIDYFLGDAEPRVFVTDPDRAGSFGAAAPKILTLDAAGVGSLVETARAEAPGFEAVPRGPEDLAAILYTSGTTGRSKGAMLTHANLETNARVLVECWRFTDRDVLIHALPIFHTHGLFVATNITLMAGGSVIFLPGFDADAILAALPRATAMMGVPTFYTRLLARPELTREICANMRLFVSGSAPLLAETHDRWRERTGHAILERYGMTETSMTTSNPYDGERRAGTVGFPLPGIEVKVCDPETGERLPDGDIGVLEVRGPNVFKGYWRMPEKTAEELRPDGWFVTGDLSRIDERGYVQIVGRGKDLIISGGFNVYPKEVETEIDAIPGVEESAVIGAPHPDFGEAVVAVVVRRKGAAVDEAAIRAALSGRLAKFKQPKEVIFAEALPRNTMGKVQKNALRDAHKGLFAGAA